MDTELRFLALGDSYTIGQSVPVSARWPVQLAVLLRENGTSIADPEIVARTGWTTRDLAAGIEARSFEGPYDIVTLMIGVNNQFQGWEIGQYRLEFVGLLQAAVGLAGGNSAHVIVVSIPDWGVTPFGAGRNPELVASEIDRFNTVNREEASKAGAAYVDVTGISRQAKNDLTLVAADGLHPSGKMYGLWAEVIRLSILSVQSTARPLSPMTPAPYPPPISPPRTISPTSTPTSAPPPTPTVRPDSPYVELAPICTFDEPQRQLSCRAEGRSGGELTWASNVSTRGGRSEAHEVTLGWGDFFDEIQVQVEECAGSTCSLAATTLDVDLQARGDCPDDFNGWFTTFPLPMLLDVYEVGPPGRILTDDYKGHGYFRVPNGQNALDVRMPIDATLAAGSVYLAPDEPQYLLFFRTACEGLTFLFDHIREPVPAIADLFTDDPPVGDSRTYAVGPLNLKGGSLVGTSIGTLEDGNAFVDFGVNDSFGRLPTPLHPNAHGRFLSAVCIYTFFDADTASYLKSVEHPGVAFEEGLCP